MRSQLSPIRVLYAARLLSGAAFSSLMPFVLLHFTGALGLTPVSSGSILSVQEIMPVFTGVAIGWLVIRTGTRRLLTLSLALMGLATLEWMTGSGGIVGLWLSAVMSGVAFSAVRVGFSSSIPDLLAKEEASHGFAMLHAFANVGFAVGPLLNSYWVSQKDYAHAFWVPIGLYFFSAAVVGFGLPGEVGTSGGKRPEDLSFRRLADEFGAGGMLFLGSVMLVVFFNGVRLQADIVGLGKYFVDYFHSTKATSLYWTVQSGAVVFLVPLGGRLVKRWEMRSLFTAYVAGTALIAVGFWSLGYFAPTSLTLAFSTLIVLSVLGECLCVPAIGALLVNFMGPRRAGVAFGLATTISALGMSSGASLAGVLLERSMRLNSLPDYWQWTGVICTVAFLTAFILGWVALQVHEAKPLPQEA